MADGRSGIDLTVIVPVYDERENLIPLVRELLETVPAAAAGFEILLVDDGSLDGSAELIETLARAHPRVRGIRLRTNRGQTAALAAGFAASSGRSIVTLDADMQNDPRDIPRLLEQLQSHAAAVGYRSSREDPWLRRVSSRVANTVRNRLSGDDIIDTGCSLKAFRRDCLADVKLYAGMHRFLPTLLRVEGHSVVQVPVGHRPRRAGRSKYGVWNRLFRSFGDLLAVRWMKKRRLDYEVIRDEP